MATVEESRQLARALMEDIGYAVEDVAESTTDKRADLLCRHGADFARRDHPFRREVITGDRARFGAT